MVGPLELAGLHGVPDLKALRDQYATREAQCPDVEVQMPPVAVYRELLEQEAA
ncbi:hypothetical protein ACLKMY_38900 [Paraburkholderia mimosarum]|uniref:hypothetical protein n=1 Tax=Paraburkholderia mimosarum TaxID=312026 RepID=UPI000423D5C6